jgi:hypothetical protein
MKTKQITSLQPATREEIVKILAFMQAMLQTEELSIPLINGYIKYLEKYPMDLLEKAADHIIKTKTTYYNKFPPVSEFCIYMDETLQGRKESLRSTIKLLEQPHLNLLA